MFEKEVWDLEAYSLLVTNLGTTSTTVTDNYPRVFDLRNSLSRNFFTVNLYFFNSCDYSMSKCPALSTRLRRCIGRHVVLLQCWASKVCPAFSNASKLNESVAWRLCSPTNRFHHCLVNFISFSCLVETAFTQITEILLLFMCHRICIWRCAVLWSKPHWHTRSRSHSRASSHSHASPSPSTCVPHPLTCPRPCSLT